MTKNKSLWKRTAICGASALLSLTLALGAFTACKSTDDDDDDDSAAQATDTQLIKNGNFEFYSEMDEDLADRRDFISSPTNWSFTSGTPSSNTASGIIDTSSESWTSLTKSSFSLISDSSATASAAIQYAIDNWDKASVYDRLNFYEKYDEDLDALDSSSTQAKFFADYQYSIDFEDVQNLAEELGDSVATHYNADDENAKDNSNVLMIHNERTSDNVRGTGQYYTSSTTVTLQAGTSAKVSVWVRTSSLYHHYAKNESNNISSDTEVTRDSQYGGAYIGITNTVGGTTLDQMQIKNIRTIDHDADMTNGWKQYTVYVRASTFATSTFRIVLGLGISSSSNRLEAVDGYAFFDDLECTIIPNSEYETQTKDLKPEQICTINDEGDDKICDIAMLDARTPSEPYREFALDLYDEENVADLDLNASTVTAALTTEQSGTKEYVSKVGAHADDYIGPTAEGGSVTYGALQTAAASNTYLKTVFDNDIKDGFPFVDENNNTLTDSQLVMLLSVGGASYEAKVLNSSAFTVQPGDYMYLSFFVKTSEIRTGRSGASATVVDAFGNETEIAAFDSTTIATVDITNNTEESEQYNREDIYNGWVQCFFFIENDTETAQTFSLKLNYGTKAIADSSAKDSYADGYAAFANFKTMPLTKSQYGYASTGSQAVKVSLSDTVLNGAKFDSASRTTNIEEDLATPASFSGVVSTSIKVKKADLETDGYENSDELAEGFYTGLVNAKYADNYKSTEWYNGLLEATGSPDVSNWWENVFGETEGLGRVANQPLVIFNNSNAAIPGYGYFAQTATVASGSTQRISMRVKLSKGATVYLYLIDTSDAKSGYNTALAPTMDSVTYWYDDNGNICSKDPSDKDFDRKTDIAFYLEKNGLYTKAGETNGTYYANLRNFATDEKNNLVTANDEIAYYYNDGKYYAYYDADKNVYSQVVLDIYDNGGKEIARYESFTDRETYQSVIKIEGTEQNEGKWIDVSFYVRTGEEDKEYRLEIWAGSRDFVPDTVDAESKSYIPAGAYVFLDAYSSADASSNYETLLAEKIQNVKDTLNEGKTATDEGYIGSKDNLPAEYALYDTYTFYDNPSYLRYDETTDEDGTGNLYSNYVQSDYAETLIWMVYDNTTGEFDDLLSYSYFLDYTAYDVTVTPQSSSTDTDHDHDHDDDSTGSDTNFLLIFSSVLLAVVLVFAIAVVGGRQLIKWLRATGRIAYKAPKAKKDKKEKKSGKLKEVPEEEPTEPEQPETADQDETPYDD